MDQHATPFDAQGEAPWEPPVAGSEADALLGALERLRWTFRFKVDGLGASDLSRTIGVSRLTLGGLLKHMAAQEDYAFGTKLSGTPLGSPWTDGGWDGTNDWEFTSAGEDSPEFLYRTYDDAVARSRERIGVALSGSHDLGAPIAAVGGRANLRRLICDLLEEYGRHTGHADLLREAVDGRAGEDPPEGWRPQS